LPSAVAANARFSHSPPGRNMLGMSRGKNIWSG
jgi:hypothetical protein